MENSLIRRLVLKMAVFALGIFSGADLLGFSWIADKHGSMIITRASLLQKNKGEVVEVFKSVVFSRDETKKSEGVMILDDARPYEALVTTRYIQKNGEYLHSLSTDVFVSKLQELVGIEKVPSGFGFACNSNSLSATEYSEGKSVHWYILDRASQTKQELPKGTQSDDEEGLGISGIPKTNGELAFPETSVLVQIGTQRDIADLERRYKDLDGFNVYKAHFTTLPIEVVVYASSPGVDKSREQEVARFSSLDIRFHNEAKLGALVMLSPGAGLLEKVIPLRSIARSQFGGRNIYDFDLDGQALVDDLIRHSIPEKPELECVLPDDGFQYKTACHIERPSFLGKPVLVVSGSFYSGRGVKAAQLPFKTDLNTNDLKKEQLKNGYVTLLLQTKGNIHKQYRVTLRRVTGS